MIYLAQPGDRALADPTHGVKVRTLREQVEKALDAQDLCWYDPIKPFGRPMRDTEGVYRVNEFALSESKGMLAILPFDVPTIGTPMEILTAATSGKPVAVVGGRGSLQLRALSKKYSGLKTFDDMEPGVQEAIQWLASRPETFGDLAERVKRAFARGGVVDTGHRHPFGSDHVLTLGRTGTPVPAPEPALKWQGPKRCEPKRSHESDCGYDLFVEEDVEIAPGGFADVSMGIRIELPPDVWGMVTGRSSTIRKRQLLVTQGIIDNGYRGEIFAGVQNLNRHGYSVARGERIAQLLLFPMTVPPVEQVDFLTDSDRGERAFGSTGD